MPRVLQKTVTANAPRPVPWFAKGARILIGGQAPRLRVHESGRPFTDPSGDRLRDWMEVGDGVFYDLSRIAIVPMAFCFPGYNDKGHDLVPPATCAKTWCAQVMDELGKTPLTLLISGHAQTWHLAGKSTLNARIACWRDHAPRVFPLPHPSWHNTGWPKKNPWFETDLLPALWAAVKDALT